MYTRTPGSPETQRRPQRRAFVSAQRSWPRVDGGSPWVSSGGGRPELPLGDSTPVGERVGPHVFPLNHVFSSVQPLSRVRLFATPWTAARQASLCIATSSEFAQIRVHVLGSAVPLLSPHSGEAPRLSTPGCGYGLPSPCLRSLTNPDWRPAPLPLATWTLHVSEAHRAQAPR